MIKQKQKTLVNRQYHQTQNKKHVLFSSPGHENLALTQQGTLTGTGKEAILYING